MCRMRHAGDAESVDLAVWLDHHMHRASSVGAVEIVEAVAGLVAACVAASVVESVADLVSIQQRQC